MTPIGESGGINLYGYVGGDPVGGRDPSGLWGGGTVWSVSAEGGAFLIGAGVNAAVGSGYFYSNNNGLSSGLFANFGGFIGGPNYGVCYPKEAPPFGSTTANGIYAGIGQGGFVTNANNINELSGAFNNFNINTPFFSAQLSYSNNIFVLSYTKGSGMWFSTGMFTINQKLDAQNRPVASFFLI